MNVSWLSGIVVHGDGRGRKLGFPTANLSLKDTSLLPPEGVYAAYAELNGKKYKAAVHIGPRPAVNDDSKAIEVHLLEFPDRDLYGEAMSFRCVEKLRDVRNFDSIEELVAAIKQDCNGAAGILS